ncbi:MAG: hypothetical protein H6842_11120 [Rhodospirillaceae bacterium]|nr:hypothetical protein [Rhodospirillaceae bacterium]
MAASHWLRLGCAAWFALSATTAFAQSSTGEGAPQEQAAPLPSTIEQNIERIDGMLSELDTLIATTEADLDDILGRLATATTDDEADRLEHLLGARNEQLGAMMTLREEILERRATLQEALDGLLEATGDQPVD